MTLPANFKFKSTEDPKIIEQLYTLCGTEWGGKLTPEQFGSAQAKGNFKYVDEGGRILSYYIEDVNTGTIVATTSVKFCKAFYKQQTDLVQFRRSQIRRFWSKQRDCSID